MYVAPFLPTPLAPAGEQNAPGVTVRLGAGLDFGVGSGFGVGLTVGLGFGSPMGLGLGIFTSELRPDSGSL